MPSCWKAFSPGRSSSERTARMHCDDSTEGAVPPTKYVLLQRSIIKGFEEQTMRHTQRGSLPQTASMPKQRRGRPPPGSNSLQVKRRMSHKFELSPRTTRTVVALLEAVADERNARLLGLLANIGTSVPHDLSKRLDEARCDLFISAPYTTQALFRTARLEESLALLTNVR
jgi:hypothetical protein